MPAAPIPGNEIERLHALDQLGVLDSEPEPEFDRAARLAAHILDVPIALVSLVDEERQWFKACVGLDAQETPRDQAFCAWAIHSTEPLVVRDATSDERFSDNPLVIDAPEIRFYAGAPLITPDGHALGTLCAIDRVPREPTAEQLTALRDLAAIVVDEMELRRLNRRVHEMVHELERSNRELTDFAHTASHDLRAPLRHIYRFAQLLQDQIPTPMDPNVALYLEHVRSATQRLDRLTADLLDYARLGDVAHEFELLSLEEIVDESLEILAAEVEEAGAEISRDALPEIHGERALLQRLVLNLLSNALKYRSDAPARIHVGCETGLREILLRVSDNGLGVPEEHRERIFESFQRLHAASDIEGTGLGLSVCRRICEAHGGEIRVDPGVDGGSVFSVRLPLRDAKPDAPAAG